MGAMAPPERNSRAKRKPETVKQVPVRMTEGTYAALAADAEHNFRTVNMHILWLIQERLNALKKPTP